MGGAIERALLILALLSLQCSGNPPDADHTSGQTAEVPVLAGLTLDDAKQQADLRGFNVIVLEPVAREGMVVRQDPPAGSLAQTGTVITVEAISRFDCIRPASLPFELSWVPDGFRATPLSPGESPRGARLLPGQLAFHLDADGQSIEVRIPGIVPYAVSHSDEAPDVSVLGQSTVVGAFKVDSTNGSIVELPPLPPADVCTGLALIGYGVSSQQLASVANGLVRRG
jgi:hypothetical protein